MDENGNIYYYTNGKQKRKFFRKSGTPLKFIRIANCLDLGIVYNINYLSLQEFCISATSCTTI